MTLKFIKFGISKLNAKICSKCSRSLQEQPELLLGRASLCYHCAKIEEVELGEKAAAIHQVSCQEYRKEHDEYYKRISDLQDAAHQYDDRETEFIEKHIIDNRLKAGSMLLPNRDGAILLLLFTGLIVPVYIIAHIVLNIKEAKYNSERKRLAGEFRKLNEPRPEVVFGVKPRTPIIQGIEQMLSISEHCNSERLVGVGYSRMDVLNRDRFLCQTCWKQFNASELEVHHVIPRAEGGSDHMRNLITLCIPCHMAEQWFNHYHIKAKYNAL